jgi:hypothetical protein
MSGAFPSGPGVAQGGGAGEMVMLDIHEALVKNEPEVDGPSDFQRPQPADEGGTNNAGWTKTPDYDDGYYGIDSGPWQQV